MFNALAASSLALSLSRSLALSLLVISGSTRLEADDLFRLRFEAPSFVEQGTTFDATVLLDNTPWPAPTTSSPDSDSCEVSGFTLGLRIPVGLELVGTTFSGTATELAVGGTPYSSTVTPVDGGLVVFVILSSDAAARIPIGTGQSLLRLTLAATGAVTGPLAFDEPVDSGGMPATLVTGQGVVMPHLLHHDWTGDSAAAEEPATGPEFPPVEPGQLVVRRYGALAPVAGAEGSGEFLLGSGGDGLTSACEYDTLLGPPPAPNRTVSPGRSIQDAIDAYPGNPGPATGDWVVRVEPGIYSENIEINLGLLAGFTLHLYANGGPDAVTLTSVGASTALTITQSLGPPGSLIVGWCDSANISPSTPGSHAGWYGFRITDSGGPNDSPVDVGGVSSGAVSLIGNWFDENAASQAASTSAGGAIRILNSPGDIRVILNEFSENMAGNIAGAEGAAIYCDLSTVFFANNWIHGNTFRPVDTNPNDQRIGGGLRLAEGKYTLCRNFIYENNGMAGCGLHARLTGEFGGETLHLEANEIFGNTPWTPQTPGTVDFAVPYKGAGVYVQGDLGTSFFSHEVRFINNVIRNNDINVPPGFYVGPAPSQVGGGLYFDLSYSPDLDGELQPWFEGNSFSGNTAVYGGGGASIGCYPSNSSDPNLAAFFSTNTIAGNLLVQEIPTFQPGSGILLPADPVLGYSRIAGANCIVWDNFTNSNYPEWVAECSFGAPPANSWTYCVMPDYQPACPVSYDLFGANSTDGDPVLEAGAQYDSHLTPESLRAIDLADQSAPGTLIATTDFDGDLRVEGAFLDRGADELMLKPFIRGDFNADTFVQISDMIMILSWLFSGPQPGMNCMLSADANDDGAVNIADPIYISTYLFPPAGPPIPPPAPFPSCGFDTTPTGPMPLATIYDLCLDQGCP